MVHKSSRDAQIAHDQELRVHRLQLGILNPSTVEDAEHWSSAGILERLAELGATPAQLAALERYQPEASPTIVIDVERAVRLCNELLLEPAEKSDSFLAGAGPRGRPRLRCGEPAAADLRSPEPRWRAPCPLRTYPGRPRPREPRARARTPLTRLRPASRCPDALIRVSCRAARGRRRGRACLRSYGSRRLLLGPHDALRSRPLPLTRRTGERAGAARMGDLEPDDFFVAAGGQSAGDPYGYLRRRPGARGRGGPPAALGAAGSGAARSDASGRAGVASCGGGGGVGVGAGSGAGALVLGAAGRAGRLGGRAGTVALDAGRRVLSGTGQSRSVARAIQSAKFWQRKR